MKLQTVKTILNAAMNNQQLGLIKFGNNRVVCDFTASAIEKDMQDIVAFDNDTEVVEVLGKARNAYIDCEAIESIEVFR